MNGVVLFGLIISMIIRIIGMGIALDFYLKNKDTKYILFFIGWFMSFLAPVFPILAVVVKDKFLYLLNLMTLEIGMFLIVMGIYSYFHEIKINLIIILSIIQAIVPLSIFFLVGQAMYISIFLFYLSIGFFSLIPIIERNNFKTFASGSIHLYYLIIFLFFAFIPLGLIGLQGYTYGLYHTDDLIPIFFNYAYSIALFLLMLIFIIYLEYSVNANKKDLLKDKYSHDLGNTVQAIFSSVELIKEIDPDNKTQLELLNLAKERCDVAAKLIKEIRKL